MARRRSEPPSVKLVVLLLLGATGLALFIVGVGTAAGWKLIIPGSGAILISLSGAWLIQKRRDKTLR